MKQWIPIAVLAALAAGGCEWMDFGRPQTPSLGRPAATGGAAQAGGDAEDRVQYSILLCSFPDALTHAQDAERWRQTIAEKIGWKDLFVVHKGAYSQLFWGHYASEQAAQANLKTAHAYRAQDETAVFAKAMVGPLPTKDIGPPEWNLKHARGAYTVVIAVFRDDPDSNYLGRKKRAVDYCQQLRDGKYEGYYLHGPVESVVTIGAFPASSVVRSGPAGDEVSALNDPRITAIQKDFPLLAVNGWSLEKNMYDPTQRKIVSVTQRSYLTPIPKPEPAAGDGGPGTREREKGPGTRE